MTTIIYTNNFDWLFSIYSNYCGTIFISLITIISLPIIFLSGGVKILVWDGTKWVGAGVAFGAGEYIALLRRGLDQITGNNGGNSSGGNTSTSGTSGGGNTSTGGTSGGGSSSK